MTMWEKELQDVFAEHDRVLLDDAESDRRIRKLREQIKEKQRADDGELVYKRFDPPVERQPVRTQQTGVAEIDARVVLHLKLFREALTKAIAHALASERAAVRERIANALSDFQRDLKLPVLRGWTPGLHLEGSLVICAGGLYQAKCDTVREPGSFDWQIVACPGHDGMDGRDLRDSSVTDFRKRSNG